MQETISALRQEYQQGELTEETAERDPFQQFQLWFQAAITAHIPEPNAMTLATVDGEGQVSARIVLLKDFSADGFVFFTNYQSQKGRNIAENPGVSLVFWWPELSRQVRIAGCVSKVSEAESDSYFQTRPRGSQLGAWVSSQSQVIANRQELSARLAELDAHYAGQPIPRPPFWGGYQVEPRTIEFWQGQLNRLHDRLLYSLSESKKWIIQRLSP